MEYRANHDHYETCLDALAGDITHDDGDEVLAGKYHIEIIRANSAGGY